jgi:hypothetical protein
LSSCFTHHVKEKEELKMSVNAGQQAATVTKHGAMMEGAKTSPMLHEPRHVSSREVRGQVHGTNPVGRFNNLLAVLVTNSVGSMWAAYLFILIALVSFPQALNAFLHGDAVTGVAWLSQSFLQLVLLPVLLVGQRVISTAQDARAETDHETLTALHRINVQHLQILETLAEMRKQQPQR